MVLCCILQARQLCELLDFAEQERLTLLEKEAALQQELEQVGQHTSIGRGGLHQHSLSRLCIMTGFTCAHRHTTPALKLL